MALSRREFTRLVAGAGAVAAIGQLGRLSALAAPPDGYRAMVGVFLFGGNDGWNMVIPTDARHAAYLSARGSVGVRANALTPLSGSAYALHPAMNALRGVWDEGALGLVLNAGTLFAPLTKAVYQGRPDLRPANLMSHSDEQKHWHAMRARGESYDGFLGRIADRTPGATTPTMISLGGSNLAVLGRNSSPLILPSSGAMSRIGYNAGTTHPGLAARNGAIERFASGAEHGSLAASVGDSMASAFRLADGANAILTGTSTVDAYFVHSVTGAQLNSDVSRQLLRVARMIEARATLGHARQTFFVSHGGYDTHSGQVNGDSATGRHAALLGDLAEALAAFHRAMRALGVGRNVTAFTMSDFGRTYKGNAQLGTDHAWGSNHLVLGGDMAPQRVHGAYPDPVLGGVDDISRDGRFIPAVSQEEYVGAIARWHGVADADLPYVFPNWAAWSSGGRGPLNLFRP